MISDNLGPITHRRVLNIAVPIVISNSTVPILGIVDTGVVGQLGQAAPIGAVGIGAIILTTVYWFFGFLRISTSGLAAQARGQQDQPELSALLIRGLLIAAAAGLVLILSQTPILNSAFLIAPASIEVEVLARQYTEIRVFSAPAAIAIFAITGWLIALERTRSVLVLQVVTNGINIVLDLVFVLWLDFGVRGVAVATVIAECSGLALGIWLCRNGFSDGHWRNPKLIFSSVKLMRMASMNRDILIRNLLIECAFVSFLFLAADIGDLALAANQILFQFLHVTAYALDGFAFSAEALVGVSVGARTRSNLRRAALLSSFWAGVAGLLLAAGFATFGPTAINILTNAPEVQAETKRFLFWAALAPIIGGPSWMLDGIFIGATRTRDMRNSMAISTIFYALSIVILLPVFGNHGLWASIHIFFLARAITLGLRYFALENGIAN